MSEIANLGVQAASRMREIADQLGGISPCRASMHFQFGFQDLGKLPEKDLANALRDIGGRKRQSIYSFHLDSTAKREEFLSVFESSKLKKLGNLAYPRINKGLDELSTDCLYVGTSRDTEKRLKEHLGFGDNRTYALHLAKWATSLAGGIQLSVHPFELSEDKLHLLPYLEDALAAELKPLLGRRGNL
jgi:hypothetical protein